MLIYVYISISLSLSLYIYIYIHIYIRKQATSYASPLALTNAHQAPYARGAYLLSRLSLRSCRWGTGTRRCLEGRRFVPRTTGIKIYGFTSDGLRTTALLTLSPDRPSPAKNRPARIVCSRCSAASFLLEAATFRTRPVSRC